MPNDPSIDLREKAASLFKEAADIAEGKAELKGDDLDAFNAKMAEAAAADELYVKSSEGQAGLLTLKDRLSYYHGKATGNPIPWSRVQIDDPSGVMGRKSAGQQFVESETYTELKSSGALDSNGAAFRTSPVEVKAATDIISGTSAAAGDRIGAGQALILPDFRPGILPLPQRPLTVRDLFSGDTTQGDQISYAVQTAFDNAAAAVSEAAIDGNPTGAKPQSSIGWGRRTEPIETIATWMAATRKQLSDAGQTRSLIDNQLRLMLDLEIDDQLMNGNGTAPNISGLLDRTGLQTLDLSSASTDKANLNGLRTAKRLVRTGPARAVADAVVMHPVDSEEFDLLVDQTDRYRAGDPFGILGPTSDAPPIWKMRRVESEAVTEGTAIVGAFKVGGTVFERQGITVLTSDSHSDFFTRNLIAVLAETRLGLAIYFPSAFCVVTLNDWADGS
jgi:HK97 family phage major capsid protein